MKRKRRRNLENLACLICENPLPFFPFNFTQLNIDIFVLKKSSLHPCNVTATFFNSATNYTILKPVLSLMAVYDTSLTWLTRNRYFTCKKISSVTVYFVYRESVFNIQYLYRNKPVKSTSISHAGECYIDVPFRSILAVGKLSWTIIACFWQNPFSEIDTSCYNRCKQIKDHRAVFVLSTILTGVSGDVSPESR